MNSVNLSEATPMECYFNYLILVDHLCQVHLNFHQTRPEKQKDAFYISCINLLGSFHIIL